MLYQEHAAEAFRYAVHLTGERADAEDIVQHVFLQAHRHVESGRDLMSPRAWLLTAVRHRAFNLTRDRREVPLEAVAAAAGSREHSSDEAAELAEVRGMLWTLPEAQHQAFVLRHWSGLSQGEIAEVLETTPSAVESLLARARAALLRSHESASETCSRVRGRLLDAAVLAGADEDHVGACRSCRQARARLTRAANLAGSLALVPGTHVADSLARLVPGFSAHVATSSAAAAGTAGVGAGAGSGGATATWGTTAVTTAGKMTVVAKAAAAVVATTAMVGSVPPAQHALSRLVEHYASAHRPASARHASRQPTRPVGTATTGAPSGPEPAAPASGDPNGHAPAENPGRHAGAGNGHGKPADPGAGAGKTHGKAPGTGGNGKAVGRPAGAGGHAGGKPAGAGGGKPAGTGVGGGKPAGNAGGNGNAGGSGNAGGNGNAGGSGNSGGNGGGGNGNGGGKPAGAGGKP